MRLTGFLLSTVLVASAFSVESFAPTTKQAPSKVILSASRREAIGAVFVAVAAGAAPLAVQAAEPSSDAAESAPLAAQEEEPSSELIETLKVRTEVNREANENYATRANKLSQGDFDDQRTRRPSFVTVKTPSGKKEKLLLTKEDFETLVSDGKIKVVYGTRMKQGGGEIKDYNDITYVLAE